jgi:hypothetical protein
MGIGGWRFFNWDLSWISCTYFGAIQNRKPIVAGWSKQLLDAFCSGCWFLFWTEDTLYWVQKPKLCLEQFPGGRRFHNPSYAALESDAENLYFWHGVLVPAFVVVRPDWITLKHIDTEINVEVRRVMIERFGQEKYLQESGAVEIHRDDFGVLYRKEISGDEPLVMVKVVNSTAEPDGSFKDYFLRVPPEIQRARQAVAWTFDKSERDYNPEFQT